MDTEVKTGTKVWATKHPVKKWFRKKHPSPEGTSLPGEVVTENNS